MPTLKSYSEKDFANYLKYGREVTVTISKRANPVVVLAHVVMDLEISAKFFSFYVPECDSPGAIVEVILERLDELMLLTAGEVSWKFGRLPIYANSGETSFTGRVFVYAESSIDETRLNQITAEAQSRGLKLIWRGHEYRDEHNRYASTVAFLSHDSRDKADVAAPLAERLEKAHCPVWYDEYSLKVGDSLRASIEKGIKTTGRCILILSPNFLSNKGWGMAEFDSIYTREIAEKQNLILPVWNNVTYEQVYEYSPRLADRLGANFGEGLDSVVAKLVSVLDSVVPPL